MANPMHESTIKEGTAWWNDWRKSNRQVRPDLRGLHLPEATDLVAIDLSNADLSEAVLQGVNLTEALLQNVNLTNANLRLAELIRADLTDADLTDADFSDAKLGGANLSLARLHGARLNRADLTGTDLTKADLSFADLSQANLEGAELTGASMRHTNLWLACLADTNWREADLVGANLHDADLGQAQESSTASDFDDPMSEIDDHQADLFNEHSLVRELPAESHEIGGRKRQSAKVPRVKIRAVSNKNRVDEGGSSPPAGPPPLKPQIPYAQPSKPEPPKVFDPRENPSPTLRATAPVKSVMPIPFEHKEVLRTLDDRAYLEGTLKERVSKVYERDPRLRRATIAVHGTKCKVCGFDFGAIYGRHGEGYIEVHHLRPISSLSGETKIDPKTDMTVLCANCHSMIHRNRDTILTPDELKVILRSNHQYQPPGCACDG